jgi:hypothetical protein
MKSYLDFLAQRSSPGLSFTDFSHYFFIKFLIISHFVVVAVHTGFFPYILNHFFMNFRLVCFFMVFCIMALIASVVGDPAPVTRLFPILQKYGFFKPFNGFVRIPREMQKKEFDSRLIHGHPAPEPGIPVAAGAVDVVLGGSGGLPLVNRRLHLMTNCTGICLAVSYRCLVGCEKQYNCHGSKDNQTCFRSQPPVRFSLMFAQFLIAHCPLLSWCTPGIR